MKRRSFLNTAPAAALAVSGCGKVEEIKHSQAAPEITLAGKSLSDLRDEYRYWLFEDFLPFLEKHVVDHEYGGFMCNTDRDGTNITQDKRGWYEGRGIWVYSFLYNNFGREKKWLEIAEKSVNFIMRHDPGRKKLWPEHFTREGELNGPHDSRGYGSLFIANGLSEFAVATGDTSYRTRAREILLDFVEYYDRPSYAPGAARGPLGNTAPLLPGARVLGVWMVIIRLTTQMLTHEYDADLKAVNDRCIEAIRKFHFNPEFDLLNEVINHDMTRPDNEISQLSYLGHAIETLWMLMAEAVRRKDKELYFTAAEWFHHHVEVAWDDVYGGIFHSLKHVNDNIFDTKNKVLWAQEEVLVGALSMVEHIGEDWAREWFGRMYDYVLDKFPLAQYGFPIWNLAADRKVTFVRNYSRIGNFHHPRHLMLNILALDRMIERNGAVSDVFA